MRKKAWVKSPVDLQDLAILAISMKHEIQTDLEIHVKPFINLDSLDLEEEQSSNFFILGINREWNKYGSMDKQNVYNLNDRHLDYIKHLRFSNPNGDNIPSKLAIKYSKAFKSMRKSMLSLEDLREGVGAYSISSVYTLLSSFKNISNIEKSFSLQKKSVDWMINSLETKYLGTDNTTATREDLESEILYLISSKLGMPMLQSDKSYGPEVNAILSDVNEFLNPDGITSTTGYDIIDLITDKNKSVILDLWIEAIIIKNTESRTTIDLWESCDFFSYSNTVLNTSGEVIKRWKHMLSTEKGKIFFATKIENGEDWIVISRDPDEYPLIPIDESNLYGMDNLLKWVHPSKFMAKTKNLTDMESYLSFLDNIY